MRGEAPFSRPRTRNADQYVVAEAPGRPRTRPRIVIPGTTSPYAYLSA
jgi:hypothetical protein